jgi:predicted ATPase
MRSQPQHDHRLTELDPGLLATPFRVHTNWLVIAGGPCCGKTTLIRQLARQGFRTVPEVARDYIQREVAGGHTPHPIRTDGATLQRRIKDLQLSVEGGLPANEVLFLDGGVPSSLAWYRAFGLDPNEMLPECFHHRYASVFALAPLPFRSDDERAEEVAGIAHYLDEWQIRDYGALGYSVVRVPVLPPEERLTFVLERMPEQGRL